ncbi:MAG: hypothetical protein ACRDU0_01530 [Mycobacterium sp.]
MAHTHEEFVRHAQQYGVPVPLPLAVREAYTAAGMPVPAETIQIGVITPPDASTGRCCHCGTPVAAGSHPARHAVEGFEHTPLRLPVLHCDGCANGPGCDPAVGGGFCEPMEG